MKFLSFRAKFTFLLALCALSTGLPAQGQDRFFDQAEAGSEEVRLVAFYPIVPLLETLAALRQYGFLSLDNLVVVGVYHEGETGDGTDYQSAKRYVEANKLTWIKFHRVTGELNPGNLFRRNPCSAEFEAVVKKSDGVIFFGGADIPPLLYGQKTSLLSSIETPRRHYLELSFIFHLLGGSQDPGFVPLLRPGSLFPVLGMCLGCQSLNVGRGGTLIQDVWSDVYGKRTFEEAVDIPRANWHRNPFYSLFPGERYIEFVLHPLTLKADGLFCAELGMDEKETPQVLSGHHQALGKLGRGMKVAATSLDGRIIEAIQAVNYPGVLGVQFHPEYRMLWDEKIKSRLTPEDKGLVSFQTRLAGDPASVAFHHKLWAWFCREIAAYHRANRGG